MSIADSAVCDILRRRTRLAIVATRPAAEPKARPGLRTYPFLTACRPTSSDESPMPSWQIREERGEYVTPDQSEDENDERGPEVFDAAAAHTEEQREAMCLLDDAENLLAVLMAAIEDDGDSRAMQAETVLKVVREKLREAHTRINRQESHYRNLFLAYFELKARSEREVE